MFSGVQIQWCIFDLPILRWSKLNFQWKLKKNPLFVSLKQSIQFEKCVVHFEFGCELGAKLVEQHGCTS